MQTNGNIDVLWKTNALGKDFDDQRIQSQDLTTVNDDDARRRSAIVAGMHCLSERLVVPASGRRQKRDHAAKGSPPWNYLG
jgi:hypothetical protein